MGQQFLHREFRHPGNVPVQTGPVAAGDRGRSEPTDGDADPFPSPR